MDCWLLKTVCLCEAATTLGISISHRLYLYLHCKGSVQPLQLLSRLEYGRSTNTGIALYQALPKTTEIIVCGDTEQEQKLSQLPPEKTVVLFPSSDAYEVRELILLRLELQWSDYLKRGEPKEEVDSNEDDVRPNKKRKLDHPPQETGNVVETKDEVYNIIILDATWRQGIFSKHFLDPHQQRNTCRSEFHQLSHA